MVSLVVRCGADGDILYGLYRWEDQPLLGVNLSICALD